MSNGIGPNRYNSTPRKLFDKHVDRMEIKRVRDREDHRADMQALIKRLVNLENQLTELLEHQKDHCHDLDLLDQHRQDLVPRHGREGL